jgi:hypothetical protein
MAARYSRRAQIASTARIHVDSTFASGADCRHRLSKAKEAIMSKFTTR